MKRHMIAVAIAAGQLFSSPASAETVLSCEADNGTYPGKQHSIKIEERGDWKGVYFDGESLTIRPEESTPTAYFARGGGGLELTLNRVTLSYRFNIFYSDGSIRSYSEGTCRKAEAQI